MAHEFTYYVENYFQGYRVVSLETVAGAPRLLLTVHNEQGSNLYLIETLGL